jgi:hypothetical protein
LLLTIFIWSSQFIFASLFLYIFTHLSAFNPSFWTDHCMPWTSPVHIPSTCVTCPTLPPSPPACLSINLRRTLDMHLGGSLLVRGHDAESLPWMLHMEPK